MHRLVHFELFADMASAIEREKVIKKWRRAWKLELIEKQNPDRGDLWSATCASLSIGATCSKKDDDTPQMQKRQEILGLPLPASGQTPHVFEGCE